jgi:hypothetical protein
MDGTAGHSPLGADYSATRITLVRRPDRRQIPTRRAHFRGGRRADDFADELPAASTPRSTSDGSARAQGSAIVMGWEPRPGTLRRAAGSY